MAMRTHLMTAALVAALAALSPAAEARTVRDEPYSPEQTWNAAIRLIRVDFGFNITERDPALGYFTFEYREGARTVPGSVEIVRSEQDGRPGARIIVQVTQMPTYVESMILGRLGRKLRDELGEPAAPRRPAAPDASAPPPPQEAPGNSPVQPRDRVVVPQNPRLSTDPVPEAPRR